MNPVLQTLNSSVCLAPPKRLWAGSGWTEHVPFAMHLVELVRPRTFVELGTHTGVSYCAFCQAVAALGLDTRCYAIDTWQGDEHSGVYGPEVLLELRAHHDPLYGAFSRLMQSTFEDARASFDDGSVDLLHIDGFHSYEAVRRDFEGWLPKLSRSGVVLLHDTTVRERGFGVWRLWDETSARYPHFSFSHGHGLGLLAVGDQIPPGIRELVESTADDAAQLRNLFSVLGSRLSLQLQRDVLQLQRDVLQQEVSRLGTEQAELARRYEELRERAAEREASMEAAVVQNSHEIDQLRWMLGEARRDLDATKGSLAFQIVQRYWAMRERALPPGSRRGDAYQSVKRVLKRVVVRGASLGQHVTGPAGSANDVARPTEPPHPDAQYRAWLERNGVTPAQPEQWRKEAEAFGYRPLVSIVTPVYNVHERWLRRAIESVLAQAYPVWELCLVDDASTKPHVRRVLDEYAARDDRIRIIGREANGGIAAASQTGVEHASGEFIALLDHDDELAPEALFEVVKLLNADPHVDLFYSDEDKLDENGRRVDPFFKPDWSPDLLMSMNYVCHLAVVRKRVLTKAGGFQAGYDGSQDYDLFLRVTEQTDRIVHIPKVLYHWRKIPGSAAAVSDAKPYAHEAAKRALESALSRRNRAARIVVNRPGTFTVRYAIAGTPKVTIVIPTKDMVELLKPCVESIINKSSYDNYEIVVVDNNSSDPATLSFLDRIQSPHRVIRDRRPFNWAGINNSAAARGSGEHLLFLNNDMEVIDSDWIEALLEHSQRKEVGAVGAKLLYPDNSVQHAGVLVGIGGVANHAFRYVHDSSPGYFGLAHVTRNYSAVTGACMMVRRQVFEELGGFDENLRVAFNDVDFCLRLRQRGYLIVYTPHARLYHFESASRSTLHPPEDERYMRARWEHLLRNGDPYYNPNFAQQRVDFSITA
jgi:GT2 family glycosyltransferase